MSTAYTSAPKNSLSALENSSDYHQPNLDEAAFPPPLDDVVETGTSSSPVADHLPIFVDTTGQRARVVRRVSYAVTGACAIYTVTLGLSLAGATSIAPSTLLPLPGVPSGPILTIVDDGPEPLSTSAAKSRPTPRATPRPTPSAGRQLAQSGGKGIATVVGTGKVGAAPAAGAPGTSGLPPAAGPRPKPVTPAAPVDTTGPEPSTPTGPTTPENPPPTETPTPTPEPTGTPTVTPTPTPEPTGTPTAGDGTDGQPETTDTILVDDVLDLLTSPLGGLG